LRRGIPEPILAPLTRLRQGLFVGYCGYFFKKVCISSAIAAYYRLIVSFGDDGIAFVQFTFYQNFYLLPQKTMHLAG
jgi:hypothetical protein